MDSPQEENLKKEANDWITLQLEQIMPNLRGLYEGFPEHIEDGIRQGLLPGVIEDVHEEIGMGRLIASQGEKLRSIVNLIRGTPPESLLWSTHDAVHLVADMQRRLFAAEKTLNILNGFLENITLKAVCKEALAEIRAPLPE